MSVSVIEGLRESLASFARERNYFEPVYVKKHDCNVSYNGSFYTVFLPHDVLPPTFAGGNPAILLCESNTTKVWRIEYSFDARCKRRKEQTAVVATPVPVTVVQKIVGMEQRQAPPWEILGVSRTSDAQQVTRAYCALCLQRPHTARRRC